jgi:hypothetical protein
MTWIGLVNNEPAVGYPLADLIYICVSAGLGVLGAVFFVFFYPVGIYCLASLGGFYFAVYLLSWKANLVITIVSFSYYIHVDKKLKSAYRK